MVDCMGFYELAEKALAFERQGKKLIRLNAGDTNLPTPQICVERAIASIKNSKSGYGSSAGMQELRKAIAEREGCAVSNVVIGPGSKHLIFALMSVLGCKSISFPSPYWPAYMLIAKQLGLQVRTIETNIESAWDFEKHATLVNKGELMVVCNPLNPTSTIYGEQSINSAIEHATKNKTYVILDEAYKGLAFRDIPRYEGSRLVRVRSFSKEFNMEGWRLGYAIAPEDVVQKLIAFNQMTTTCVPSFVQEAGIACIENEKAIIAQNQKAWLARSLAAQKALSEAGFRFAKPDAGIYVFAAHERIKDSDAFASSVLDNAGVAITPGTDFGQRDFVRICVNREPDTLRDAVGKIAAIVK